MRQRISVEHLSSSLSEEETLQSSTAITHEIQALSQLDSNELAFCHEKIALANENAAFLLRQWLQLHIKGFPDPELAYLRLIERQFVQLSQAYLALYRFAPGLIYQLKDAEPEVFVWLVLHTPLGEKTAHLLAAFEAIQNSAPKLADLLVVKSNLANLDLTLAEAIDANLGDAARHFELLKLRHTLSSSLTKRWLKAGIIKDKPAHVTLASFNVADSIEWVHEHLDYDQALFERLLVKQDRNTWFRQYFGIEPSAIESTEVHTYAKLLELKEFDSFDVRAKRAAQQFALRGETAWTEAVLDYLPELDELEGEEWLGALYVVYGDLLPVKPSQLGIEHDWESVLHALESWREEQDYKLKLPSRLGYALSFESSLSAMQSAEIHHDFRDWIWKQLCLHSRVYLAWNGYFSATHQQSLFSKIKHTEAAAERFNFRNHNAVVGH